MKAWQTLVAILCALACGVGMGLVARGASAAPGDAAFMVEVNDRAVHRFLDVSPKVSVACYVATAGSGNSSTTSISCVRVAP